MINLDLNPLIKEGEVDSFILQELFKTVQDYLNGGQETGGGIGDVLGPATNTNNNIPQWDGVDSKTLKNGLAVPVGGLAVPAGFTGAWAGADIPTGYLDCDGSAISRATYAALFAAIGTVWGAGDGSTTFNIPDLRSATLRGVGTPTAFVSNTVIALATKVDDKGQGHSHELRNYGAGGKNWMGAGGHIIPGALTGIAGCTANPAGQGYVGIYSPYTDGTNGTPRTGTETSGKAYGVHHIIKY